MPKLTSKSTARAASYGGLPAHPALSNPDPLLQYRLGSEAPIRLPDTYSQPTAATVLRNEYTLSSDANGHCVWHENYTLFNARQVHTVTAGSTGATPTYASHPQMAAFAAEARVARQIATKIQVLYIGAEQTSAGYLSFAEKTSTLDVVSQTVDALHTGALLQVKAEEGVLAHIDFTQEPRWEDPSSPLFMESTFPIALFVASGLPTTTPVFRVRVARFMEYLPKEGAIAENNLQHEPSNPGAMSSHGELSGNSTSYTALSKLGEFIKGVKTVANAAYHMAQPMLPYVVPRARAFLASNYARAAPLLLGM